MKKILRLEGEDTQVSEMFYQEVVQTVLFFRSELWDILEAMKSMVEVSHVVLLRQINRKRASRTKYCTWETPAASEMLRETKMKTADTYIGCSQGMVSQYVALHPIFEVCEHHQCFEGEW